MASNASLAEAASVAVGSLRGSKLRSFLTLLGIILATTTLIVVMAIINGMDRYIAEQVSDMGVDGFRIRRIVMIGESDPKKWAILDKRNPELTRDEFAFVKANAKLVRDIGMESGWSVKVKYANQTLDWIRCQGVTPNIGSISNAQVASGRFIGDTDDRHRRQVAFIGNDLREEFFPNSDPIGKSIDINGQPFEVIGVAKAQGTVFGQSRDSFVMIPIETFFKLFSSRRGLGYNALALNQSRMNAAQDEVRSLLRAYRQLRPGQEDDFGIVASESLTSAWGQLTGTIAATAVAIVSVFMVVGGVVIMNIMLAVVTERTHEIGIRKSVGARKQDILNQFLVESSVLSGIGGLLGVLIAWAIAILVRNLTPVPMAVPISAVLVGVGLSTLVGLFFGIYPARQAARLDPIEALRYE